jgi:hypothetical protein
MKCNFCGTDVKPNCDWQQGRCPHRSSMIDDILLDNYKARYYNLINSLNNLFKGISNKWQQRKNNKN